MKPPTATQINLLQICRRQLWLHSNELRMEHTSEAVYEGKMIGEQSYGRRAGRWREVDLGHIKIDHYDPVGRVVREVKKSNRLEAAYVAQVKYYIHELERRGEAGIRGLIEYPRLRRITEVEFKDEDRALVEGWIAEIGRILSGPCPELVKKSYCRTCSYREFCYV